MTFTPAQTIIQLYNQLHQRGSSRDDLNTVREAYELVVIIFTGQYRANGKTFISHLVGTASVIAHSGGRIQEVVAGLLHSAYSLGEFGDGTRGVSSKKRQMVRNIVGEEVEQIVYDFPSLEWNGPGDIERLLQTPQENISEGERRLIWMRLAHEVEENADRAFIYSENVSLDRTRQRLQMTSEIAGKLGLDALVVALNDLLNEINSPDLPEPFDKLRSGIIYVAPASHSEKLSLKLMRAKRYINYRIGRLIGR
ncbi:MAG: hypothetical protein O3C43_10135 [Verrucomicrobia bacterium]|nr:hypothetical protein [Verrucomicrobiota bacterium]MDA1066851.1 hypothetical protein [Verrucomicrobiota bacterium]